MLEVQGQPMGASSTEEEAFDVALTEDGSALKRTREAKKRSEKDDIDLNPDIAKKNRPKHDRVDAFDFRFGLLNNFNQLPLNLPALTVLSFKLHRPVYGRCVPERLFLPRILAIDAIGAELAGRHFHRLRRGDFTRHFGSVEILALCIFTGISIFHLVANLKRPQGAFTIEL